MKLANILSHLINTNDAKPVTGLEVTIAQVIKVKGMLLESLQKETKANSTLPDVMEHIINGGPDFAQDLQNHLHPFCCFRDELIILYGLVIKGNCCSFQHAGNNAATPG